MPQKTPFKHINIFFKKKTGDPTISALAERFRLLTHGLNGTPAIRQNIGPLVASYEEVLLLLEEHIAATGFKADLIKLHKNIFVELEGLLTLQEKDDRHSFLVVIPVADRPIMLKNCLNSLLRQCADFNYGGKTSGGITGNPVYAKIVVLVIDDSKDRVNTKTHKAIAKDITKAGLRTHYIGLTEQSRVVREIPERLQKNLKQIIGDCTPGLRPHKGASITRNIAYLLVNRQLKTHPEKALIHFIDSDEEFGIKVEQKGGPADISTINYFYWLDKLFTFEDIEILTGKVVGDPPVSPAVMINTFLDDVLLFFKQVSACNENDRCIFHCASSAKHSPAHYHDLVKLFGYKSSAQARPYLCSIKGKHTVSEAFKEFSKNINGFFYGFHPTRKTIYYYHKGPLAISAARTVYTGHFVLKPKALRYFIPYADLRLRMAGPVLGRLLQARIGPKFVSANLPLLHKRTLSRNHPGEFRPGLNHQDRQIDLSDEATRQFWGDVLLFSVEELTKYGYPDVSLRLDFLTEVVDRTKEKIWHLYAQNGLAISDKTALLKDYLKKSGYWWNRSKGLQEAVDHYKLFCSNLNFNFGIQSKGYQKLKNTFTQSDFPSRIARALYDFYEGEKFWNEVYNGCSPEDGSAKTSRMLATDSGVSSGL